MNEWTFRLKGDDWDLEDLAYSFKTGPAIVQRSDDFYYLLLPIASAKSEDEAFNKAKSTLAQMSAICLVQDEGFRAPTISGIAKRDLVTGKIGGTKILAQCHIVSRTRVRVLPTLIGPGGIAKPKEPTFAERTLAVAVKNAALRETLRTYISVQHEWPGLYRVFETVQKANNGKIPPRWATKRELRDFRQSSNDNSEDPTSRHGFDPSKPKNPPRMTVAQGRALVQKLLEAWIKELIMQS
jgi:hypothetical protein